MKRGEARHHGAILDVSLGTFAPPKLSGAPPKLRFCALVVPERSSGPRTARKVQGILPIRFSTWLPRRTCALQSAERRSDRFLVTKFWGAFMVRGTVYWGLEQLESCAHRV